MPRGAARCPACMCGHQHACWPRALPRVPGHRCQPGLHLPQHLTTSAAGASVRPPVRLQGQQEQLQVQRPGQLRRHCGRGRRRRRRRRVQEQQEEQGGQAGGQRGEEERAPHQPRRGRRGRVCRPCRPQGKIAPATCDLQARAHQMPACKRSRGSVPARTAGRLACLPGPGHC